MSLISHEKGAQILPEIRKCFEKMLMPLAIQMRSQKQIIPWMQLDSAVDSYYGLRKKRSMSKHDFELGGCNSIETFESELIAFWDIHDESDLYELASEISNLAKELHCIEEENEEVSPFIYVMF